MCCCFKNGLKCNDLFYKITVTELNTAVAIGFYREINPYFCNHNFYQSECSYLIILKMWNTSMVNIVANQAVKLRPTQRRIAISLFQKAREYNFVSRTFCRE